MTMQTAGKAAVLIVVGGLAAGCSETGFQDFFGAGKYAPDETKVSTNQPLAAPPDLQLRPPSDEEPPERTASRQPDDEQQDLAAAPGADEAPQEAAPQPYPQQAEPQQQTQLPQPQQRTQQQQPQQQASAEEPQDAYERWGVSRYHPDGREKSQVELHAEMREKKLERERQRDPNYGTIWNMGSIWSDG